MRAVSELLGIGTTETVRKWVRVSARCGWWPRCAVSMRRRRQAEVDAGTRPGTTTEESAELKRLKRENAAYLRSTV